MSSESSDRDRKLDELARRFRERLGRNWPEGEADVTQVEERVGRIERETLRELAEGMLREQTGKREGNQTACPCGGKATYRKPERTHLKRRGRFRGTRGPMQP